MEKHILIMGIRGIPAGYGGFETFAENLALYLVKKGWDVTVYCQVTKEQYSELTEEVWKGVRLIHIPVKDCSAKSTIIFDYLCMRDSLKRRGVILDLGYNTAVFNVMFRLKKRFNIINMDGVEWKRSKWGRFAKLWLYINERLACYFGNHLVADHPEIKNHILTRGVNDSKITMISYGARLVNKADESIIKNYGLELQKYAVLIARPEPENYIWEVVKTFSEQKRGIKLVVLGDYSTEDAYQKKVLVAAGDEVLFIGSVYDHTTVDALRFHSLFYIHGHRVGGSNPSLIEALGAGQAIMAHDNEFNRWVAGSAAVYFANELELAERLEELIHSKNKVEHLMSESRRQHQEKFKWDMVLNQYEGLLVSWIETK